MNELQKKMTEKMFALFGGVVQSLSDIQYAIQNDAEYMKIGNPSNQAKNDMSQNIPEDLDYSDVDRDRLEEYFMYAADKDVAYFADSVKAMKEIEKDMAEYKKALLKDDFEKVQEAFKKVGMILMNEGTGIEVTDADFLMIQEETEFAAMKKESVQAAFKGNSVLCRVMQEITHDNNLFMMHDLQKQMKEAEKPKAAFKENVMKVIEKNDVYITSESMVNLWEEYCSIKEGRREVYNNYKNMEFGKAEMEGLGAAIGNLKEFGAKSKAPDKKYNSTEYDKFEAEISKYKEAEAKGNFPQSTEEKMALVSSLREAAKEYLDAKKSQFSRFPS